MTKATASLVRQIRQLTSKSDAARDTEDNLAWAKVQEVVALANLVYDRIKRIDEEWSAELVADGKTPQAGDARAMERLYATWCAPAEANLHRGTDMDARGQRIEGLDRLRQACFEARSILSIPTHRVRRAAQNARAGRTRPLGAFRDELRGKLNA